MAEVDRIAFERFVAEHGDRLLHAAYGLAAIGSTPRISSSRR
jgi:hypothetical protein